MENIETIVSDLKKINNIIIKKNAPLSNYTTLKTGGPAAILAIPSSISALKEMLLITRGLKKYIIGNGSNLLLPDSGLRGIVIRLSRGINDFECDGRKVVVGGGTLIQPLIRKLSNLGLSGLEFAIGIPAATGGAIAMNMGALGSEIGDLIEYVEIIDASGKKWKLCKADMKFSYRKSHIHDCIIVSACLKMRYKSEKDIKKKIAEYLAWRKQNQPISVPSAGSVFKNPKDVPAGKLIDMAGLKGLRIGGAEVSKKHANFIINLGDARTSDIKAIIRKVRTIIKEKFKVNLEIELVDSGQLNMLS